MPPIKLVAFILTTTILYCRADVKHVIDGTVDIPSAKEINNLGDSGSSSISGSGAFASASASFSGSSSGHGTFQAPGKADFWWLDSNSPLKHAYDYFKKCQESGDCVPPINPTPVGCTTCNLNVEPPIKIQTNLHQEPLLDLKKNPFFNGDFKGVAVSSCTGAACKNGQSETVITTCKGNQCDTKKIQDGDFSKNPFFNGDYKPDKAQTTAHGHQQQPAQHAQQPTQHGQQPTQHGQEPTQHGQQHGQQPTNHGQQPIQHGQQPAPTGSTTTTHFDASKNPFLNGGNLLGINDSGKGLHGGKNSAFAGNGDIVCNDGNGFIGVQPAQPFGGKNVPNNAEEPHQLKPFSTTHPGLKNCTIGHVCLPQQFCPNGKLTKQEDLLNAQRVSDSLKFKFCFSLTIPDFD